MEEVPFALPDEAKNQKIKRREFLKAAGAAALIAASGPASSLLRDEQNKPVELDESQQQGTPERAPARANPERDRERIRSEIEHARRLAQVPDSLDMLESPYLISALYYSDSFLKELTTSKEHTDPTREILRGIIPFVTVALHKRYVSALIARAQELFPKPDAGMRAPFPHLDFGKGINHPDALDVFMPEGSPIHAIRRGIAVLSESGWTSGDPLSTSSARGGNSVIVFAHDVGQFYRYAHLRQASVLPGTPIEAGTIIGAVGSTGSDACIPGHGEHLHLEVNRYDAERGRVFALFGDEIRKDLLTSIVLKK